MHRPRYPSESDRVTGKSAKSIYCTSSPEMVPSRAGQMVRSVPTLEFPRSRSHHARQYIQYLDRTAEKHLDVLTDDAAAAAFGTVCATAKWYPHPARPGKRAAGVL